MTVLDDDPEIEELYARDWTVYESAQEAEYYSIESTRLRKLKLAEGLAKLCGLDARLSCGELTLWRGDAAWKFQTTNPAQAMDWIDGYSTCLERLKEKK